MSLNAVSAKQNADVMSVHASTRSKRLKVNKFASFPAYNLQEIGAEQDWKLLRASLAFAAYAEKDLRVGESFFTSFRAGQNFVALIIGGLFLQTVLNTAQRGSAATLDITTISVLEAHMFYRSIAVVGITFQAKTLKCSHSYSTETPLGFTV